MKDSTTYQAIIREGKVEALQTTLLRQGRKRFGPPGEEIESAVRAIQDVERLENLTERLLDTSSWQELLGS